MRRQTTTMSGRFRLDFPASLQRLPIRLNSVLAVAAMMTASVVAVGSVVIAADAPKVTRVYPPGIQRGQTATIRLIGKPGDGPLQVWSDRAQLKCSINEARDQMTIEAGADVTPGLHWLRFYNDQGATPLIPFCVGLIPETAEVEPNNAVSNAQPIDHSSTTVTGVLEKTDDVDLFRVRLPAGKTFVATVRANEDLKSPMDASLQLLDESGTVLLHNDDDHGFDPQLTWTPDRDCECLVRIFAFPAAPNSTIRLAGGADYVYRLTLTTEAVVDHTRPMVIENGKPTDLQLQGWNLPQNVRTISSTDAQQEVLADGLALPFALTTNQTPGDVESPKGDQELKTPGSITGVISQAKEADRYTLPGTKGRRVTLQCQAQKWKSPLDPLMTVTDASGKVIREVDDSSRNDFDILTDVTFPDDQPLTITVTDRFQSGSDRHFYLLSATEIVPHYAAALKEDAYLLPRDKPLEITVTIDRKYNLQEPITVSIEDLPEGISAAPVVSEKEGDSAKSVKLKLEASPTAPGFSGLVRIVCASADSGMKRIAQTSNSLPDAGVWLTLTPPPAAPEKDTEPAAKPEEAASKPGP